MEYTGKKDLGHRLQQARDAKNLTREAVISMTKLGFSRSSLQAWENGEREPSIEVVYDLARIYEVHPWALLSGEESPNNAEEEYCYIPVYNIEVSAGHGMFSEGAEKPSKHLAFRRRWIEARNLNIRKLSAVFTAGDSMEPTIPNGAAVVVDHQRNKAMDGKIYIIRIGDRLWVKRVQWTPTGGLNLISDNKELYQPYEISKQDLEIENNVEIIGQVIHVSYDLPD